MAANLDNQDEEPISLNLDSGPQPVPVPPPGLHRPQPIPVPPPQNEEEDLQPVPVPPPSPRRVEPEQAIELVDEDAVTSSSDDIKHKRLAGAAARGLAHKLEFRRQMNLTGQGATRCRLFYSKIADGPLLHMETMINDWLDEENIEVKHVGHVIGTLEGKRAELNLLVMIWY